MASFPKRKVLRYLELEEERLSLQRRAKLVKTEQAVIEAEMEEHVRANGGKEKQCTAHGVRMAILSKRTNVSWKDAYIESEGADAAEKLIAAQPNEEYFSVERLPPPTKARAA
jgi:hypothetical protein